MKPIWTEIDNRDDRREIHRLLQILHPQRRVAFLEKCCARAKLNGSPHSPKLSRKTYEWMQAAITGGAGEDDRLTQDCLIMLYDIALHFNFPLRQMVLELEQWGRRQ